MELSTIIPHIEALIFASDKPLTTLDIVELINNAFGFMDNRITLDQVEASMEGIREKYNAEFYPFEVRESGGGWQFLTKKDFHKTVGQLNGDKFLKRLSNAALETLAIIAYKQPITKGEVEAIRGVNSDYSVQKLLEKELIIISGRSEELPGKPLVYATSRTFMDYFGLNTVDDLPKIKEVLAEQQVEGTLISDALKKNESVENEEEVVVPNLTVTDSGELVEYKLNKNAADISTSSDEDNNTAAETNNLTETEPLTGDETPEQDSSIEEDGHLGEESDGSSVGEHEGNGIPKIKDIDSPGDVSSTDNPNDSSNKDIEGGEEDTSKRV